MDAPRSVAGAFPALGKDEAVDKGDQGRRCHHRESGDSVTKVESVAPIETPGVADTKRTQVDLSQRLPTLSFGVPGNGRRPSYRVKSSSHSRRWMTPIDSWPTPLPRRASP